MLDILIILGAHVLQQILSHHEPRGTLIHRPWLGVSFRIVEGNRHIHTSEVASPVALNRVQRVAMWTPRIIHPRFVVDSNGVHYERIAVPPADGVPYPRRLGILRQLPPVCENLPERSEALVKDQRH